MLLVLPGIIQCFLNYSCIGAVRPLGVQPHLGTLAVLLGLLVRQRNLPIITNRCPQMLFTGCDSHTDGPKQNVHH